jgi:hypothetical protein
MQADEEVVTDGDKDGTPQDGKFPLTEADSKLPTQDPHVIKDDSQHGYCSVIEHNRIVAGGIKELYRPKWI